MASRKAAGKKTAAAKDGKTAGKKTTAAKDGKKTARTKKTGAGE